MEHNEPEAPCGATACSHTCYVLHAVIGKGGMVDFVSKAPPEAAH